MQSPTHLRANHSRHSADRTQTKLADSFAPAAEYGIVPRRSVGQNLSGASHSHNDHHSESTPNMQTPRLSALLPLACCLAGCGTHAADGEPSAAERFKAQRALPISAETLASVWGGEQGEQEIELTFAVGADGTSGNYALSIGNDYLGGSFEIDEEDQLLFDSGASGRGKLTGSNSLHLVYSYETELYDVELTTR